VYTYVCVHVHITTYLLIIYLHKKLSPAGYVSWYVYVYVYVKRVLSEILGKYSGPGLNSPAQF